MVDYEAMMSPMGGTGYGDKTLGSGLLAGVGAWAMTSLAMSDKLMMWEISKGESAFKGGTFKQSTALARKRGSKALQRKLTAGAKYQASYRNRPFGLPNYADINRTASKQNVVKPGLVSAHKKLTRQITDRRTGITALRDSRAAIKKSFRTAKSSLKALGWVGAISDAFFIAEGMFNPGPALSAKAQAMDMAALNPLQNSGAFTQRQRAIQAIHDSQLSITPMLGNESQYLHR